MRPIIASVGSYIILNARKRLSISIADIVDETGLAGYYSGEFRYWAAPVTDPLAQTAEDASEEQLGLTWQLRKAPGTILVIRSSARAPTEN